MRSLWVTYKRNWIFWTVFLYLVGLAIVLASGMVADLINKPPPFVVE
jgi:hypothetical protein